MMNLFAALYAAEDASVWTTIWSAVTAFISGIFGAIGEVLSSATTNPILLVFVIVIPLFGLATGLMMKFLGKKKKK